MHEDLRCNHVHHDIRKKPRKSVLPMSKTKHNREPATIGNLLQTRGINFSNNPRFCRTSWCLSHKQDLKNNTPVPVHKHHMTVLFSTHT